MAISLSDVKRCFWVPAKREMIDDVHPVTGRGLYGNRTLDQIRAEEPDAVEEDIDVVAKAIEDGFRSPVEEITEERFTYFLEVLPPVKWTRDGDGETFRLSERTSGCITLLCCRLGDRFFSFHDDIRTPHAEIVKRCRVFVAVKS